jgi:NADP-dependent 3-hydroxy acid dehydrogenase YdfG
VPSNTAGAEPPAGDAGARLLVVGATSGIGRAFALAAARAGHRVLATGRRAERLDALRSTHPNIGTLAGDVRSDDDCAAMVRAAVERFGGLDAFVYATGTSPLGSLVDTDGDAWRTVFETNVVGAAQVCRAAIPHLVATGGRALFLSSISADDPRPYLVAYGASKAALDAMVRGWRNEHPGLGVLRVVVGPTVTEFGARWDPATTAELARVRTERNLVRTSPMTAEQVADEMLHVLTSPVWAQDVTLVPDNTPPS